MSTGEWVNPQRFIDGKDDLPTVAELNEIHRQWMALQPDAPEKEKQRVFKLMERYPRNHISTNAAQDKAQLMISGMPFFANPVPIDLALERCHTLGGRTDVAWNGHAGAWVELDRICAACNKRISEHTGKEPHIAVPLARVTPYEASVWKHGQEIIRTGRKK